MEEMIELEEHRAIMCLPANAVAVQVNVKVYEDGEIIDVGASYSLSEIREMFRKADEGYIDDDDTFVITEKGKAWLEERNRKV